jgi:hypothetical protein
MKYLLLLAVVALSGCDFNRNPRTYDHLPSSIGRFRDGDVTCWVLIDGHSISCVKDALPENED